MAGIPLAIPTVVVLAVVVLEWRHTRLVAYCALAAAFVLLVAVLRHPALSAEEVVAYGEQLLAAPLAAARAIGAACFLFCVVRLIRSHEIPW